MKIGNNGMVRLQLLGIIFCIGFSLNASQQRNDLEWLFFSADRSANAGHLGIFYDPQHCMQKDVLSFSDLCNFRKWDDEKSKKSIDHIIHPIYTPIGQMKYFHDISTVSAKQFIQLLSDIDPKNRGLILYYTIGRDQKNYVEEIKQIRQLDWHVIAMCHELQIAKDIDQAFFGDNNKSKSIKMTEKSLFYKNILVMSVIVVVASWLWHKYDLSSYF